MGRAVMTASARRANEAAAQFDEIVRDFPKTPNVHYAWGTFLLGGDPDKAVMALKRELEVQPDHLPSLVLLALEFLKRGDAKPALEFGRKAAEIAPQNFTAHVALGRALVESGEVDAGIVELEVAVKLEPTSPQTRIALASAYQRAGNTKEAARHRAEFQKLKQALEAREKVQ
jgi:predicted Zn-dependent protease